VKHHETCGGGNKLIGEEEKKSTKEAVAKGFLGKLVLLRESGVDVRRQEKGLSGIGIKSA